MWQNIRLLQPVAINTGFMSIYRFNSASVFVLVLLCLAFAGCAGTPRHHLAIDASLIEPGQSQEEVLRMLGPPNATRTNQLGQEEWHYYETRRHFWHKLPFSERFSKPEVEALMVVLEQGRVRTVQYYVPVPNK